MRKKNSFLKFIITIIFIGLVAAAGFLFLSPQFEQKPPQISFTNGEYWNLKTKLHITITDQSGIKYYKITFIDDKKQIVLDQQVLTTITNKVDLQVSPPKLDMFYKGKDIKIKVEAIDNSKWNFFNGNMASKTFNIKIDTKKPIANVINNSRYIRRGGSAIVVVKVKDENLKDAYISFNNTNRFVLIPFYKPDYYVALIAWDINIAYEDFDQVNLIAIDKAGNKTISKVPLYIQKLKIKQDNITISDKFISNVSRNVLEQMGQSIPQDSKDIFIKQNDFLRQENIKTIKKTVMDNMDKSQIDSFAINRFKRLKGSRTAAGFAERRSYYYHNEKIDEQWHLGLDFASVRHAAIRISNSGKVIFNSYLGIYGNTIIIDHGMGLASLYAHTTDQYVQVGDMVNRNKKIATTGTTGAVMGDHLHFGILIQGIEVNPIEWMDKNWIKTRILNILTNSKKMIKSDK